MKVTVINGTEKHGVTWKLKEEFLSHLEGKDSVTEFYLPRDCPAFCVGCTNCFMKGESLCKDSAYIQKIEQALTEADLLVFTTPAYVFHATGAMKAMLDHFGYRWMPHRPSATMFSKRAVIISQCLGAGGKSAAKDIKDSLSWWGISYIKVFSGSLMTDIHWDKLPDKKRTELTSGLSKLAKRVSAIDYSRPARTGLVVKLKFYACRMIQKSVKASGNPSYDAKYWEDNGWLRKERPWKAQR